MMQLERLSNLELLRILSMFGVLTSHSLMAMYNLHTANFSIENELRIYIMNASVLAVNCFILISGYFQIKQSWKGFIKFLSPCFVYSLFFSFVAFCNGDMGIMEMIRRSMFPLTETNMWFIITYLGLFLISPLLNAAFNSQDNHQRVITLIGLLIVDVYLGYIHQSKEITIDGYHLVHFIVVYYIGSFIHSINFTVNKRKWSMLLFLLLLLMTGCHMIKMIFPPISIIYSMRYNSPFVLLTSIVVFLFFSQLKYQSKKINWIASSVFSVYIISEQPFVKTLFYNGLRTFQQNYNEYQVAIVIPIIMIIFYFICIFIDKIRIKVFASIEVFVSNKIIKIFEKVYLSNNIKNNQFY